MTAVEWLYENILINPMYNEDVIYNEDVLEMAKEMEKQQIIDVVEYYCPDTSEAEQYYNETFNNED